jgi:peptide subunit release factor 1 (eRF1)
VRKGGWSQQRYERRRDKELLHYAKEINDVLRDLVHTRKFDRIVLLGSQETLAKLQEELATDVAERVVGASTADLHAEEETLIKSAYELFFAEEREAEARLWERIQGAYLSDGLAAVGPKEVLDALVMGRAAELLVTRDAELTGTRCAACERVTAAEVERCPHCDDEQVFPVDLVEELVRQAELTSAPVEFSDPIPGLTGIGDVAVLLRY